MSSILLKFWQKSQPSDLTGLVPIRVKICLPTYFQIVTNIKLFSCVQIYRHLFGYHFFILINRYINLNIDSYNLDWNLFYLVMVITNKNKLLLNQQTKLVTVIFHHAPCRFPILFFCYHIGGHQYCIYTHHHAITVAECLPF